MAILGVEEFKIPGIEDKNVTEEQFNELMKKLGVVSFQLQEIGDTLDGRVLSANIHNESIQTRHLVAGSVTTVILEAESVTTEKLATGEIVLATIAEDFNWSTLVDDGNKPDDNADVTGDNTAADIINLPATPSTAGLYASGTYLGYHDGSNWKAYIQNDGKFYFTGDANNYVQWNGTSLAIKGTITLLNTIDWQTGIAGTGKPDDDADVTLAAINGELSVTGGGIVLSSTSPKIRAGQTAYATGTGFWLGMDSGTPKFSIGNATDYLKWTGTAIQIKTTGALSSINVDMGAITAGNITLNTSGFIRTDGKDNYADTTAGIFFGYDGGAYKLNIGSSANYLKWTGSALEIKGRLSVGLDTNEDIYFEDSGIRMYDSVSGDEKSVHFKYSTLNFARLVYEAVAEYTDWRLCTASECIFMVVDEAGIAGLTTTCDSMAITANASAFLCWTTGQFSLPNMGSNPASNLAVGQLSSVSGVLKFYDGAWKTVVVGYVESAWTPALKFGGNSTNMTYSIQAGEYTKIGRLVVVTGYILLTNKGTSTGIVTIEGLPFTSKNADGAYSAVSLRLNKITFANIFEAQIVKNTSVITLSELTEAGNRTSLRDTDFENESRIVVTASYFT